MVENKKEKLKAIINSYVEDVELTVRNNHLNRTINKKISVEDEYYYIVPWQQIDESN